MASTRNVVVNFITKLSGRGIENLQKESRGLDKALGGLQRRLLALVSAGAFFRFLRKSTQAFVDEDKAVQALATNLRNLGIAYDIDAVENYISQLQRSTTVADDELRPALQQLLTTTRDLGESQRLLSVALDISAGTGKSLSSVVQALSRAFLGNNTSLGRLNVGLSKAELATKDFDELIATLSTRFTGQAAAAADTYAGKLLFLQNAAADAQEILGEKLVQSIEALTDPNTGVPALADSFEQLAEDVGNFALGLSTIIGELKGLRRFVIDATGGNGWLQKFSDIIQDVFFPQVQAFRNIVDFGEKTAKQAEELEKIRNRDSARYEGRLNKILDAEKKIGEEKEGQSELEKKRAAAAKKAAQEAEKQRRAEIQKRLAEKFDIDAINLTAALSRKLSEEDKARVQALQAIKTEGAKDDEAALNRLIELERKLQEDKTKAAAADIALSTVVKNQRLADLDEEIKALKAVSAARQAAIAGANVTMEGATAAISSGFATNNQALIDAGVNQLSLLLMSDIGASELALLESLRAEEEARISGEAVAGLGAAAGVAPQVTVNNYIQGNVTSEKDLFDAFLNGLYDFNRTGTPSQLGGFGRTNVIAV